MPHGVVLVCVSQQDYSPSQLVLDARYLQVGSTQPNKGRKPSLITAQFFSAHLKVLRDFFVDDVIEVADSLGQDLPKLHGIGRLKELYRATTPIVLDRLYLQKSG